MPENARYHLSLIHFPNEAALRASCRLVYGQERSDILSAMSTTPYIVGRTFGHDEALVIHDELKRILVAHNLTSSDPQIASLTFNPFDKNEIRKAVSITYTKTPKKTKSGLLLLGLATILAYGFLKLSSKYLSTPAPDEQMASTTTDYDALITHIQPRVDYRQARSFTWETAQEKLGLHEGDTLRTFDHATASLRYRMGSVITIQPNTLIVIGKQGDRSQKSALLENGSVRMRIAPTTEAQQIRIETPEGFVELRGDEKTSARMDAQRIDGKLEIALISGSADFSSKKKPDQKVLLQKQQKIEVQGETISPPSPFQPALRIVQPLENQTITVDPNKAGALSFAWEDLGDDVHYLFEIFSIPPKNQLDRSNRLFDQQTKTPYLNLNFIDHGLVYWQVTGFQDGVEFRSPLTKIHVIKP